MNEGLRQALMDFLGDRYAEEPGGVVLTPASERELLQVLRLLRERQGQLHHGLRVSRARFSSVGAIDATSATVEVGAGARLDELEKAVNARDLSLGPLSPGAMALDVAQFLEGPTAGLRGIPGGRLETACLALTAVMADGLIYQSRPSPRSAAGPDLDGCFLGAEGRLGLVLRAVLRLFPRPASRRQVVYSVPDVSSARRSLLAALGEGVWMDRVRMCRRTERVLVEATVIGPPEGVERDLATLSHQVFGRGGRASGQPLAPPGKDLPELELGWESLPELLAAPGVVSLHRLSIAAFMAAGEALPLPPSRSALPSSLTALYAAADPLRIFGGAP